jgi:hypothetical protein
MDQAKAEIIRIEANDVNRSWLDAAYRGLVLEIENLVNLLEPDDAETTIA